NNQRKDRNHQHADTNYAAPGQCCSPGGSGPQRGHPPILSRTPMRAPAMRAERVEFVGMIEAIPAQRVTNLFALKNRLTMGTAQEQILRPIPGVTGGATQRLPCAALWGRWRGPVMMAAMTVVERAGSSRCRVGSSSAQHTIPLQALRLRGR